MNQDTQRDNQDEEILTYDVSDEALESASGTDGRFLQSLESTPVTAADRIKASALARNRTARRFLLRRVSHGPAQLPADQLAN